MAVPKEVIAVIKEGIRPAANDVAALYYSLSLLQDRLDMPGGVSALFEALTGQEPIDDGAAEEGRPIATPENVKLFIATIRGILDGLNANGKQNLQAILALSNKYRA